ncbi:MAG TPA: hypothetical protein VGG46_14560 [Terriglobales bacterium]|jgi:hypothetical protein
MSTNSYSNANDERRRLTELYASMTDGELQKLASDEASLTDMAWEILEDELDYRGLLDDSAAPEENNPPALEATYQNWMTVREFRDLPEALLAQGCLQSAGIECTLGDANLVRLDWFYSNLVGGIKLRVKPEDARAALDILKHPIPAGFNVEGVGIYEQPKCPQCGSLDVAFEGLDKPVAYASLFIRVPLPIHNKGWKCHACQHEWPGEDPETPHQTVENDI